jgi:hypothetical protein
LGSGEVARALHGHAFVNLANTRQLIGIVHVGTLFLLRLNVWVLKLGLYDTYQMIIVHANQEIVEQVYILDLRIPAEKKLVFRHDLRYLVAVAVSLGRFQGCTEALVVVERLRHQVMRDIPEEDLAIVTASHQSVLTMVHIVLDLVRGDQFLKQHGLARSVGFGISNFLANYTGRSFLHCVFYLVSD